MSESQNHGFKFEDIIIEALTGLKNQKALRDYRKKQGKSLSYTEEHDIPAGVYPKGKILKDIQIKTAKKNSKGEWGMGLGDYLRNARAMENRHNKIIIVGAFDQKGKQKIIDEIYDINWDHKVLAKHGFRVPLNLMEKFVKWVKSIPEGREAQIEHKPLWKEEREKLLKGNEQACGIDAKIDGHNQRRVQSSISSQNVKKYFKYKIHTKNFKGISLPITINSGLRKRNKKTK